MINESLRVAGPCRHGLSQSLENLTLDRQIAWIIEPRPPWLNLPRILNDEQFCLILVSAPTVEVCEDSPVLRSPFRRVRSRALRAASLARAASNFIDDLLAHCRSRRSSDPAHRSSKTEQHPRFQCCPTFFGLPLESGIRKLTPTTAVRPS